MGKPRDGLRDMQNLEELAQGGILLLSVEIFLETLTSIKF